MLEAIPSPTFFNRVFFYVFLTISHNDCFTSKLLANADRYADASTNSRDLIDLAFLRNEQPIPPISIAKAEAAYPIVPALTSALTQFQGNADWRFHCCEQLNIATVHRSKLIDGIDLLDQSEI